MNDKSSVYDIVIIGNYTKDTIVSSSGTRVVDGGGFNYGAHVAVMMGLRIATVTRLASDDFHVVDALERLGADVFAVATPHSTHMRLEYPTSNVDERILTVTQTAGSFSVDQVKDLRARAFLINASIRGEVPFDVVQTLHEKDVSVAADVQGFVRVVFPKDGRLLYEPWPEKRQFLQYIDILKTDAVEAEMLTGGEKDIREAAKILAGYGPREIVLTHRDGVLVYTEGRYHEAGFFPETLVGRSGRGDTCIGAYVAKRLTSSPEAATVWTAAVTSLKMEAEGPLKRSLREVQDLIERKYV